MHTAISRTPTLNTDRDQAVALAKGAQGGARQGATSQVHTVCAVCAARHWKLIQHTFRSVFPRSTFLEAI